MKPRKLMQHWLSVVLGSTLAKWGGVRAKEMTEMIGARV